MPQPLKKTYDSLRDAGLSNGEALMQLQAMTDRFDDQRRAFVERIDGQLNETHRARASQLITLATLLITVTGLFISQQDIYKALSQGQKALIIASFIALLLSIFAGVWGYFRDVRFFRGWQKEIRKSAAQINAGIASGSIATINNIYAAEAEVLGKLPMTTGDWLAAVQFVLVGIGAAGFVGLLLSVMHWF